MSIDEGIQRVSVPRTVLWSALVIGAILLWFLFVGGEQHARAWRALLVNFLFFTSLAGGLAVWPAIVRSCNGAWHLEIEHRAAAGVGFALPSILVLAALWIGSPRWAPWYGATFHQGRWLNNSFVFGRDLAALMFFWGAAWFYHAGGKKGHVAGGLLVTLYALVFSLLGMDLVMALDPHWYSTLAGGYFFISGLYIAVAGWALLAALRGGALSNQLHDLGRLVVGFSLMTTYLMYAHLLPIWYEALPHEVRFIVPRMNFMPGRVVTFGLIAVVYFGPLVLLLTERSKRNRWSLGIISLLVLVGMWVERWWLVTPTFDRAMPFGLAELVTGAGMAGLFGMGMELFAKWLPWGSGQTPKRTDARHGR